MKRFIFSIFHLLMVSFLFIAPVFSQPVNLPRSLDPSELSEIANYRNQLLSQSGGRATTPPTAPVRAMAEWEEIKALIITWTSYTSILRQIVQAAQTECTVLIVCSDSNAVKSNLTSNNIPLINLKFLQKSFNSVWVRDYGPWNIYANDVDSLYIIDWIYNRPRYSDNVIPGHVAGYYGLPIYQNTQAPYDLVHTGGNFMVDGLGRGFSSKLILDENWNGQFNLTNKNETQINNIMQQFMGISSYIKMDNLPYDGIHHIDMHMKLLDEETLLVGQYPPGVADGPQIELNLQYVLNNFTAPSGRPYRVVRIPMPPDQFGRYPNNNGYYRTYTNAVFVNKTIIVPTYDPQYDTTALRIWAEAMPGYNIVGINSNSIIPASGAIHCITKEVGVDDPLWIAHSRLPDTVTVTGPVTVEAVIKHRSGIAQALVYYKEAQSPVWQSTSMQAMGNGNFQATLANLSTSGNYRYYIWAQANTGKQQARPMPAPAAYFPFYAEVECAAMTGLSTTRITPVKARLNWPVQTPSVSYEIRGRVLGAASWVYLTVSNPQTSLLDISGLTPGQTYEWQIRNQCQNSIWSAWSASETFVTGCAETAFMSVPLVTTTAARLTWQSVPGAAGYAIQGRVAGSSSVTSLLVAAPGTLKDVYGLQPGTSYEWRIRTWCDQAGTYKSNWSQWQGFTTQAGKLDEETLAEAAYEIYPNPFANELNVRLESGNQPEVVQLLNAKGQEVSARMESLKDGVRLQTGHLPEGVYLLRLKWEDRVITRKLIRQR